MPPLPPSSSPFRQGLQAPRATPPLPRPPSERKLPQATSEHSAPQGPRPTLHQPVEPPHPVLRAAGFNGSIHQFNEKVDAVDRAHRQAYGTPPSSGLVLDVVKSPVPPLDYPRLFQVPKSPLVARSQATLGKAKQQDPYAFFVTRPDGVTQPDTPLYRMLHGTAGTTPVTPETVGDLQKQYPMVMAGALPIPLGDKLATAFHVLNSPDTTGPNGFKELTPTQLQHAGQSPAERVQQEYQHEAVRTVVEAKQQLTKASGIDFSPGGAFNQDDVKKLQNWMHSADYYRKQLQFQAQDAGFGSNVDGYVKAWTSKQKAVHNNGLAAQFLSAMPLHLFGHGGVVGSLESIPGYIIGSSKNPLNIGLHGLTHTAGLTLDTVGGTVSQAKADLAAGSEFTNHILPVTVGGKGKTFEQSLEDTRRVLRENPTWLRAFFPDLPQNEHGFLRVLDFGTNLAGDLILLRKPALTGERVAAGSVDAAKASQYLNFSGHWAYKDLATHGADGVGRAASRLEKGQGARALVAYAAPLVKSGVMSEEQFVQHLSELYSQGFTTVTRAGGKTVDIHGPVLDSLRTEKLPAPGKPGQWLLQAKGGMRDFLDSVDQSARVPDGAKTVIQSVRSALAHAAPAGRLGYFDQILPERVFNFVVKNKLGDDTLTLANKLESQLVRAQGKQNVVGIQQVERKLQQLYFDKYPNLKSLPSDEPFNAVLATEAPSVFHLPGGGVKEIDGAFGRVADWVSSGNETLNKIAKLHARVILSGLNPLTLVGGFSLFWKHAFGDGLRATVAGVLAGANPEVRGALREIESLAGKDPELSRTLGSFDAKVRLGETRWALNKGGANVVSRSFRLSDVPADAKRAASAIPAYREAAGGYLRRLLDDNALTAYRQGLPAITKLVRHDKTYRGLWKSARKESPDLTAEDYAAQVEKRFAETEDALTAQGLTLDDAKTLYDTVRGAKSDAELGKWLADNKVDLQVYSGLVEQRGTFDDLTSRWVGNVIMRPNKLWRGGLGRAVLGKTFAEMKAAGMSERDAFNVAESLASKVVKYHMLDFANKLQVEQDLRWLSYFATKHRLYWKWVLGTFARHPGYAAAVTDFRQVLDPNGNIPVGSLFGMKWAIPAARLVWVPGREYDETSPAAQFVWNLVKTGSPLDALTKATGTQGNVFTRSDTASHLAVKLGRIEAGASGATYQYAAEGLDKTTAAKVTRSLNEYQTDYFRTHGHYAPESHAVKVILLQQLAEEHWRANLPLPVVPVQGRSEGQKLLAQFMGLIDPKQRREFLDKHPDLSDYFGVYQNPRTYLHNREFFKRYTTALDAYRAARQDLEQQAVTKGEYTVQIEKQRRALNDAFQKTFNRLLVEDAKYAGVETAGGVPNGTTIKYGPWGKLAAADPALDPQKELSLLFPKLAPGQSADIIGPLQRSLQQTLKLLSDPQYVASGVQSPEEIKTLKREILQKLQVFNSYPTDALGVIRQKYQDGFVNKYWGEYDARQNKIFGTGGIGGLPSDQRSAALAEFRAWRDTQDHPVLIDGVKFPSPVRMAWATLDPKTRDTRLAYLASKNYQDLAGYELDLLGVKHPENVTTALAAIANAEREYHNTYPGQSLHKEQIVAAIKQIDKQAGYHGLYSYYVNVLAQPRIRQFEMTDLYREMPQTIRVKFDQGIGSNALGVASAIKANGSLSYYKAQWRKAVREQIQPWLNTPDNADIRKFLAPYGPNFLGQLVG